MSATEITERRKLTTGDIYWTVNEFNGGESFMLTAAAAGTQFTVYFDAEQWAEFQRMVAGEVSA